MEKSRNDRRTKLGILGCVGALAFSGCADTIGTGNEFSLQGRVTFVGLRSVKIEVSKINAAKGRASGFFQEQSNPQIHDNYRICGLLGLTIEQVGKEFDSFEILENLPNVKIGEIVDINGKIRDSFEDCGDHKKYEARPVYEELREVAQ